MERYPHVTWFVIGEVPFCATPRVPPLNATPCFIAHGVTYLRGFSLCRKVRRCRVFDEFSLCWTRLRNFFDDHGMRHQTMFEFLKKGTPAYEVATALWIHGVSDSPETRALAAAASEENSLSDTITFDESVYFSFISKVLS